MIKFFFGLVIEWDPMSKDTGRGCDQAVPSTSSCMRGSESEKSGRLVCRDVEDRCVKVREKGDEEER
jgi:hypothetical protein